MALTVGIGLMLAGAILTLAYMAKRMLGSKAWDDSNLTNAIRLIAHITAHPDDFGEMYYIDNNTLEQLKQSGVNLRKPFWYINKDEFSEVVKTRKFD